MRNRLPFDLKSAPSLPLLAKRCRVQGWGATSRGRDVASKSKCRLDGGAFKTPLAVLNLLLADAVGSYPPPPRFWPNSWKISNMNLATIKVFPASERVEKILEILNSMRGPTLACAGCLEFSIYKEQGDDHAIVYLTRWRFRAEMIDHIRSPLYFRLLNALEFSERPPEVCFYDISGTEGIASIETVRLSSDRTNVGGKGIALNGKPATTGCPRAGTSRDRSILASLKA